MFVFSLRPASYPTKYLSVSVKNWTDTRAYFLAVKNTQDHDTIAFTTTQSILNSEVTGSPSLLYNPGANGFLEYQDFPLPKGERRAYVYTFVSPLEISKFYIKIISTSTNTITNRCYIYTNTNNSNDPQQDFTNNLVLSYDETIDNVYFSQSPLSPQDKIWLIDIYPQQT